MKIFKLFCTVYDTQYSWLYTHKDSGMMHKRFEEDTKRLLVKYGQDYIASEGECWAGVGGWVKFISDKFGELGYEMIEPMEYGFDASPILNLSDIDFSNLVGKDIFQKAIEHNERIGAEMDAAASEYARKNNLKAVSL